MCVLLMGPGHWWAEVLVIFTLPEGLRGKPSDNRQNQL